MTKWFDTNYHMVVPEAERPVTELPPLPWRERPAMARSGRSSARTLPARLAKVAPGLDRAELAASAGAATWRWVRAQAARDPDSVSSSTSRASAWS